MSPQMRSAEVIFDMKIQVLRAYEIETDLTPKEFIRFVARSEYGEGMDPLSLKQAAISATYACDGGDMTSIISDEGSDDLMTFTDVEDPDLVLTWQDAWKDDTTWP